MTKHIDIHAHFLHHDCFEDSFGKKYAPAIVRNAKGEEELVLEGRSWGSIARKFYDIETRLKDMSAEGIDIQVLSPSPGMIYYNLDAEDCLKLSRLQNDSIARVVKEYPHRFKGMATVPLQAPGLALDEMDRAINKLGLSGVAILTTVNQWQLDASGLLEFYKEIEGLGVPVFVHPWEFSREARMRRYHLANLVGHPFETALAAAQLIFSGILEKYPKLKFCLSHAGGNLPYIRGRLDHGYKVRPECKAEINKPPSYYLKNFYCDTITHFGPALEYLVGAMGVDNVVLGTDYPYDMADTQAVHMVSKLEGVAEKDKEKILGGNAARLFKI